MKYGKPFPFAQTETEKDSGRFNELIDKLRNRQRIASELDEAIRSWHSDRYEHGYFVVTNSHEVVPFETKTEFDGFMVRQLENQAYNILLANSFKEWDAVGEHERYSTLMRIIKEQGGLDGN
jgi:hypothetical protein